MIRELKVIPRFHIIIVAILPLVLNILVTPILITTTVSLTEFLKRPSYYIYMYGFVLWSLYHIFLVLLVYRFIKAEGGSLKEIVGLIKGKTKLSITIVLGLLTLSVIVFQIIEPIVNAVIYGLDTWKQFLNESRRIPFAIHLYGIIVTSLTAGICEEIIWRGYLQTRLVRKFGCKTWIAITIQAALFGLWHSISVHTIFTALFGAIYGWVYAKTKRLMPIIISHWLGDVIGFTTMYFSII